VRAVIGTPNKIPVNRAQLISRYFIEVNISHIFWGGLEDQEERKPSIKLLKKKGGFFAPEILTSSL
jgi:hypothetical protein